RAEEPLPGGEKRQRKPGERRVEAPARRTELHEELIVRDRQLAGEARHRTGDARRRRRDGLLDASPRARRGRRTCGGRGGSDRGGRGSGRGGGRRGGGDVVAVPRGRGAVLLEARRRVVRDG